MSRSRQLVVFFLATFAGTWGLALLIALAPAVAGWFGGSGVMSPLFYLAVWAPTLTALVLTAATEGRIGMASLLRRLDPRFGWRWWLFALVVVPASAACYVMVTGRPLDPSPVAAWPGMLLAGLVLDPGPLGEELGWRGYALPRLLERTSPLTASIGLGLIWGLWHLPVFVLPGFPQNALNPILFVAGTVVLSILMSYGVIGAAGSVIPAVVLHLMANHTSGLLRTPFDAQTPGLAVVALVVAVVAWKGFSRARGSTA